MIVEKAVLCFVNLSLGYYLSLNLSTEYSFNKFKFDPHLQKVCWLDCSFLHVRAENSAENMACLAWVH